MDHLPGFRFHPTEEELLDFYLRSRVQGKKLPLEIISTVNLYRYDPWELPGLAKIGEREWYFYVPRDHRRQGTGARPSRTTERGFWKATGCDRPVRSAADPKRLIGLKKTLVYYEGRAPRGSKTDWVMNEYRLPDSPTPKEDIVLCKIHRKAASMKELEQRAAAMEEEAASVSQNSGSYSSTAEFASECYQESFDDFVVTEGSGSASEGVFVENAREVAEKQEEEEAPTSDSSGVAVSGASWRPSLPELEVPERNGLEWMQDSFVTQLRSPWLMDFWSPSFASILNC
ncbi:NAC domain-containing protein [Canna indica]|uniref:NAC domain-containing protein n=1 Tax=Canna indica TaxID=4628 RepID=A0AAQ3L493_9LILI|nr:NAC domain-containing protein [Canna indica]